MENRLVPEPFCFLSWGPGSRPCSWPLAPRVQRCPSTDAVGPVHGQAAGPCAEMLRLQPVCSERSWSLFFLSSPPAGGRASPKRPGGAIFLRGHLHKQSAAPGRDGPGHRCAWVTATALQRRQSTRHGGGPEPRASQLSGGCLPGKAGLPKSTPPFLPRPSGRGWPPAQHAGGAGREAAVHGEQTGLLGPLAVGLHGVLC